MNALLKELRYRAKNKTHFLYDYYQSLIAGNFNYKKFSHVKEFCLFVGYGRTGHTLIGSLLDAHPNIVIGIEWNPLNLIRLGYKSKNQIYYSILKNSQYFSNFYKNVWSGYSYRVTNGMQGKYEKITIIGDKSGGLNTTHLYNDYNLLEKMTDIIQRRPKLIHTIRNPFDVITTTAIRKFEIDHLNKTPKTSDLLKFIQNFFNSAEIIQKLKDENKYEMFDLYHEEFIGSPKENLNNLIEFLGEHADQEYLEKCCAIVYKEPHHSRTNIKWDKNLILYVEEEMKKYAFLKNYNYNN